GFFQSVYPMGPVSPPVVTPVLPSPAAERIARLRNQPPSAAEPRHNRETPVAAGSAPPVRRDSSAQRGDVSVAEIRRQQAAEDAAREAELGRILGEARTAEEAGQLSIARIRYRQAAARVDGQRRKELLQVAEKLSP